MKLHREYPITLRATGLSRKNPLGMRESVRTYSDLRMRKSAFGLQESSQLAQRVIMHPRFIGIVVGKPSKIMESIFHGTKTVLTQCHVRLFRIHCGAQLALPGAVS